MSEIAQINAVVLWEHRLKMEEEQRMNLVGEPYQTLVADAHPYKHQHLSVLDRILKFKRNILPVSYGCACDHCQGAELR